MVDDELLTTKLESVHRHKHALEKNSMHWYTTENRSPIQLLSLLLTI